MTRPSAGCSALGLVVLGLLAGAGAAAQEVCPAPAPVCAVRASVFAVEGAGNGSAVRIGPRRLVTSRHLVAALDEVVLHLPDGRRIAAAVIPSSYEADLLLLRVAALPSGPSLAPEAAAPSPETRLFTVGAEPRTRRIRTYASGRPLVPVAAGKPLARLHHDAEAEPANSGGALVDPQGRLVGIIASGGAGRNEAVPAAAIAELERLSGSEHAEASRALGNAYRHCGERIAAVERRERRMADGAAAVILQACGDTRNRQFFDLAGKLFGSLGRIDEALEMYRRALEQDPHAPNTRIGVAITLHLARRYEEELPHLRWLLEMIPADPQILRFKAALLARAERAGVRPSRILRRMIRELANGTPDYFDDGLTEIRAAHRELAAIGRNLNQLTKLAQRGEHFAAAELGDELRDVATRVETVRCLYRGAVETARKRSVAYVEIPS